jgi:hypothetical protein
VLVEVHLVPDEANVCRQRGNDSEPPATNNVEEDRAGEEECDVNDEVGRSMVE